ncbi:hypothetical protein RHSIM_Rhsim05G0125000 [Rhododendron simsii]|uniref:Uncharacterized protein n=1 Tax=Rhododendron simsii TaxID=118357 RepID=A0A834H312_RHOSS|nr:hypothetical protein RHSIM_Rhsim05G0125000 [Rhododendron simsii]
MTDLCFCRYLERKSTSHLYFGVSTYLFLYVIVFFRVIDSPVLGSIGLIWTTSGVPLYGIFALILISFGYDYHWARCNSWLDQKVLVSLQLLNCSLAIIWTNIFFCMNFYFPQERNLQNNNFSLAVYLYYLVYAPLYIAGPVLSFNSYASQVLNFMWLKFFLIWRYFRFWSLVWTYHFKSTGHDCFGVKKLLLWASLTCVFFVPEMIVKSVATSF